MVCIQNNLCIIMSQSEKGKGNFRHLFIWQLCRILSRPWITLFEQIHIRYVITLPKDKPTQIKARIIKRHAISMFLKLKTLQYWEYFSKEGCKQLDCLLQFLSVSYTILDIFSPSPKNILGTYYLLAMEGYTKVCYCQMHSIVSLEK